MLKNIKKIAILGHFGFGKELLNGQTVKTKIVTEEIEKRFGAEQILKIDTHGGKKALPKLFFKAISALRKCKNVVILPAHNGVRFFVPILTFFNRFYKRKLFYVVIGGWLPQYLQTKPKLLKRLQTFDGIYVETNTMCVALQEMGLKNVKVMPNCKELSVLSKGELVFAEKEPYKLCTFSRVMKEKGIEDAINAVKAINDACGRTVYALDIYGQVDGGQIEWFENLKSTFPDYVRYGGLVPFDQSVEVLKNYFALLFPTRFFTEGIPGTIIDAYAAGVPVVSARWESYGDILNDETGIGYTFGKAEELTEILHQIFKNPHQIFGKKENCLNEAKKYQPATAIQILIDDLG